MDITIRPLTPDLAGDYFDFFENRAFTDDSPYRCYCQYYQLSKEQFSSAYGGADEADFGRLSREVAEAQIAQGALQGYLAYDGGVAVGWCNANDRANYPADPYFDVPYHAPAEAREKAVICFEIAPEYRGKGVATALLQRVISDAEAAGYAAVTAFPAVRTQRFEWDYQGPVRLYEKLGFVKISEENEFIIMRRAVPGNMF